MTSALIRETKRLKFLVALPARTDLADAGRPDGVHLPAALGRPGRAQRRDRRRAGRAGPVRRPPLPRRALRPDRRVPQPWSGAPGAAAASTSTGDHYDVVGARTREVADPTPPIYFGGSSPAAGPVAARHIDVYLTWGEPPAQVAEKVRVDPRPRRGAGPHGALRHPAPHDRPGLLRGGLAPRPVAASTRSTPPTWPKAQQAMAASQSVGQQRMTRAAVGDRRLALRARGRPEPVGRRRSGPRRRRARRWWAATRRSPTGSRSTPTLGIDEFILSGYPHLEEAHWVGEGVMPVLRSRGRLAAAA